MKKKYLWFIPPVIIIILVVFYTFFFKRVDISKIDSDLQKLSTVFTDSAVDIAQTIDEGLDVDSMIEEIKTEYSKSVRHNKIPMSINENGIAENRLAICISNVLSKNLTHPNGHLYFTSPYETFYPFLSYVVFGSDILFEKSGSEYRVYSSNDDRIKQGMLYTGSTENLYKTIADGKELYRFGVFSNEYLKTAKISVEENDYEIKITYTSGTIETVENLSYTNDDGTLYVNFNTCSWHTEAEQNRIFDVIAELAAIIKEGSTNLIVFDLRNNTGGFSSVSYSLFGALVCGTTDDMSNVFEEYIHYYDYLHSDQICINTKASRNRLSLQGYGDDNLTKILLTKADEKYPVLYAPEEEPKKELAPVYKGKILLISDIYTASAAEDFILLVKTAFPDNTIIVGQNTRGALDYATVFQFKLPDSKLSFQISMVDNTKTPLLSNSEIWHGDIKGCYPDYWFMFNGDFDVEDCIDIASGRSGTTR